MGTLVRDARADGKKSPLRGHWSLSGVIQIEPIFGGAPATAVGVLTVDDSGGYTGHGTINSACTAVGPDCPAPNPLEFDFSGTTTVNEDGTAVGTIVIPAFGATADRACVLMEKQGDCYQEFRCVNTSPNGEVFLAEHKRQLAGTCK
jgi:hypothetical protein